MTSPRLFLLLLITLLLNACGNKGDLVLPDKKSPPSQSAPANAAQHPAY